MNKQLRSSWEGARRHVTYYLNKAALVSKQMRYSQNEFQLWLTYFYGRAQNEVINNFLAGCIRFWARYVAETLCVWRGMEADGYNQELQPPRSLLPSNLLETALSSWIFSSRSLFGLKFISTQIKTYFFSSSFWQ